MPKQATIPKQSPQPTTGHTGHDLLYIGIKHKDELRRALLESSKEVIQAMKAYKKIKEMDAQKNAMMHDLKSIMADIRKLDNKLRNQLPKLDTPKIKPRGIQKEQSLQTKTTSTNNPRTTTTSSNQKTQTQQPRPEEIDRLEKELMNIENKLRMLGR